MRFEGFNGLSDIDDAASVNAEIYGIWLMRHDCVLDHAKFTRKLQALRSANAANALIGTTETQPRPMEGPP